MFSQGEAYSEQPSEEDSKAVFMSFHYALELKDLKVTARVGEMFFDKLWCFWSLWETFL